MQDVHPLILCGGIGTRLWPLSRTEHPKQFQRIDESIAAIRGGGFLDHRQSLHRLHVQHLRDAALHD